jgi:hypothetical protein
VLGSQVVAGHDDELHRRRGRHGGSAHAVLVEHADLSEEVIGPELVRDLASDVDVGRALPDDEELVGQVAFAGQTLALGTSTSSACRATRACSRLSRPENSDICSICLAFSVPPRVPALSASATVTAPGRFG